MEHAEHFLTKAVGSVVASWGGPRKGERGRMMNIFIAWAEEEEERECVRSNRMGKVSGPLQDLCRIEKSSSSVFVRPGGIRSTYYYYYNGTWRESPPCAIFTRETWHKHWSRRIRKRVSSSFVAFSTASGRGQARSLSLESLLPLFLALPINCPLIRMPSLLLRLGSGKTLAMKDS